MGDKAQAREIAKQAGVPVVPGSEAPLTDVDEAAAVADEHRLSRSSSRPPRAAAAAACGSSASAQAPAGRLRSLPGRGAAPPSAPPRSTCEKFLERARHVEVQVLGDGNGMRVHLGERDCSVQRRHQKLLEESPAPALRRPGAPGLHEAALAVAAAVNYENAGHRRVPRGRRRPLLLHGDEHAHPGRASRDGDGDRRRPGQGADPHRRRASPWLRQEAVRFDGHAIECRINAEDPVTFTPSAGAHHATCPRAGSGCGSTATSWPATWCPPTTTR